MPAQLLTHPLLHFAVHGSRAAIVELEETAHDLAISLVADSHHTGFCDGWMAHESVFDFPGVDILSSCPVMQLERAVKKLRKNGWLYPE